jgi:hypothetical protein
MTTLHTGHGPGAVISGQTMIVKTTGTTVDQAVVDRYNNALYYTGFRGSQ